MVDNGRDTVVVEKERSSSPIGWIVGIIVVLFLLAIFFSSGGFGLFNVGTPSNVNIQPAGQ